MLNTEQIHYPALVIRVYVAFQFRSGCERVVLPKGKAEYNFEKVTSIHINSVQNQTRLMV